MLMRKGTPLDGSAPLLVYGYGAYGFPQEATFSIRNLSLVDRGWIWAIAHIRGGSDKGWGWFLDGRRFNKKNTFTDFIACAEHLVAAGYGTAGRVAAYGGSAGGMLMGAIANMRPDLWGAIIAAVPFVDVLNTMSDTTPAADAAGVARVGQSAEGRGGLRLHRQLQPLRQRRRQALSADPRHRRPLRSARHLVGAGEVDRAAARAHHRAAHPMLLKINMEAGHGGASGRFDFLKEIALDYAFAVWAIEGEAGARAERSAPATEADAAAVAAIYGHHVLHGFGTFEEVAAVRGRDGRRGSPPCSALRPALSGRRGRRRRGAGLRLRRAVPAARRLSLHGRGQRLHRTRTASGRASARRWSPR